MRSSSRGSLALPQLFSLSLRRQLKELYLFSLLFAFAFSLITIFEPVFFYQQGFSLSQIALYYALHYTVYIFILPLGGKFVARFGVERSLCLSTPLFVVYFLLLAALPSFPQLFYVAWLVLAVHKIFYWPAFHADFAKFSQSNNRGTEQSWLRLIVYGTGSVGPLIGGFIAAFFGFPVLFLIAATTVLLAGASLLRTPERFRLTSFSYSAPWRLLRRTQNRRMIVAMCGWAEDLITLVFWPIWMFVILGSTAEVGTVAGIAGGLMTLWGFVVGEWMDRVGARTALQFATPWLVISNSVRVLANTPLAVFGSDVFYRAASTSLGIPFIAQLYVGARREGVVAYVVAFEIVLAIAKAVTAWGLAALFFLVPGIFSFKLTLYIAALLAFLYGVL